MITSDQMARSIADDLEEQLGPFRLRCAVCGAEADCTATDMAFAFAKGWPRCCDQTMRLESAAVGVDVQEGQA